MNDADFLYLDFRFREAGWLEAMRLRLTGSVPDEVVSDGVRNQVFEVEKEGERMTINITDHCLSLTEPTEQSFTEENYAHVARMLKMKGFRADWLRSKRPDIVLCAGALLNETYRKKLISHLSSTSV
ncbi:hypothetical protein [Thioclava sp. F28-4]|uniref:hypothetical protein n=1 Tax=Thioclava sp. F28-4 TaxID=1915315 RepID=UPI0009960C31|nr:hypothetical protein [Thioclava sp. F28-4]OOY02880.1 hypothetical protein BMI87_20465 [Thioclava sp. F28-4]